MKTTTHLTTILICAGLGLTPIFAYAGLGEDTANAMAKYYNDTSQNCGASSAPAFICSGILLRATVNSPNYHSWNPSPGSVSSGGVSFSYLRADAKFSKLAYGYENGFTFSPYVYAAKDSVKPEVLCSFPFDAGTGARTGQGCEDHSGTDEQEKYCQALGIITAEAWRDAFVASGSSKWSRQCAFDVHDKNNTAGAKAFYESIRARNLLPDIAVNLHNELRLATWKQDIPEKLPMQSFFYVGCGLAGAQADQIDWFKITGKFLPIIAITLPTNANSDAQFTYRKSDQVIAEQ